MIIVENLSKFELEKARRCVSIANGGIGVFSDPSNGILFNSKEIREAFVKDIVCKTNKELYEQDFDTKFSGSTLVFTLLLGNLIVCGNVGDSRAVIGSQKEGEWSVTRLSRDHKPELADERERIINSNGRISPSKNIEGEYTGPARVWQKNAKYPGLAMSRSLGDQVGKCCGVIEVPEVRERRLTNADKVLILGSDGIWELITSVEAVRLVIPFWKVNDAKSACNKLVEEARNRWKRKSNSIDDITCIVMFINPK